MRFSYDILGGPAKISEITVYGATLSKGAACMRGVTSGTNQGGVLVGSGAFTDFVGVAEEPVLSTQTASVQSTGTILRHKFCVNPFAVYRCEYSQATADTFTGTMTSSGTSITCASLEDLTGGFIYNVTTGDLRNISAGSGLTTLTAFATAVTSAHYVLKIQPNLAKLIDFNSVATKFGGTGQSQAAAGSGVVTILETYIQADTIPLQPLRPDLHNGLNLLGKNPVFSADIIFPKHVVLHQS